MVDGQDDAPVIPCILSRAHIVCIIASLLSQDLECQGTLAKEIGEAVNTHTVSPSTCAGISIAEAIAQASLPWNCGAVRLIGDCTCSQSIIYPDKLKLLSQQWNILLV